MTEGIHAKFLAGSASATPCTAADQAPLSMGFPRQEYWSRLPYPPPGDLPEPGIKPASPAAFALAGKFFTMGHHSMQKQQTLTNYHLCASAVSHTMSMAM